MREHEEEVKYFFAHRFYNCRICRGRLAALILLSLPYSVFAGESLTYYELNIQGGYSKNKDFFTRSPDHDNSIGFEHYKRFSDEYGDYMTTDLQMRLVYHEDSDSLDLELHNAYANIKGYYGRANLKLGHFDIPFGREPEEDTHATLLQTFALKNIGFKKDWGASVNGALQGFDYELALTLGSGAKGLRSWEKRLDSGKTSYLVSGRLGLGNPAFSDILYGLSILYGDMLPVVDDMPLPEETLSKKRLGIDMKYIYGPLNFQIETALGKDDSRDVFGYWIQALFTPPSFDLLQLEAQLESFYNDLDKGGSDDTSITLGFSYRLNHEITLRGNYIHDLALESGNKDSRLLLQLYFFSHGKGEH